MQIVYIMDTLMTVTLHEIHEVLEHFIKRPKLNVESLLSLAAVITNFWIFCCRLGAQRSDLATWVVLDDIFPDLYVSASSSGENFTSLFVATCGPARR